MSANEIIPHFAERYAEARIIGHEDWQSAVEVIEELLEVLERERWDRIFLNLSEAVVRLSAREAVDLAAFMSNIYMNKITIAVLPPSDPDVRVEEAVQAFAGSLSGHGHTVCVVCGQAERSAWASQGLLKTGT